MKQQSNYRLIAAMSAALLAAGTYRIDARAGEAGVPGNMIVDVSAADTTSDGYDPSIEGEGADYSLCQTVFNNSQFVYKHKFDGQTGCTDADDGNGWMCRFCAESPFIGCHTTEYPTASGQEAWGRRAHPRYNFLPG